MEIIIATALVVGVPLFLAQFMRANAGTMFLAGSAGIVLLSTLDPVLVTTAGAIIPSEGEAIVRLMVILATIIFASLMSRDSITGAKAILNVITALLLGIMLLLQLPELTGLSPLVKLVRENWWQALELYSSGVVVLGLGFSLLMLPGRGHAHHKHKKSKRHS